MAISFRLLLALFDDSAMLASPFRILTRNFYGFENLKQFDRVHKYLFFNAW